jgi:hypothetical protein
VILLGACFITPSNVPICDQIRRLTRAFYLLGQDRLLRVTAQWSGWGC